MLAAEAGATPGFGIPPRSVKTRRPKAFDTFSAFPFSCITGRYSEARKKRNLSETYPSEGLCFAYGSVRVLKTIVNKRGETELVSELVTALQEFLERLQWATTLSEVNVAAGVLSQDLDRLTDALSAAVGSL